MTVCELTMKDAKSLMSLDNGERLDYFDTVRTMWASVDNAPTSPQRLHKIVGNWYVSIIEIHYFFLTPFL